MSVRVGRLSSGMSPEDHRLAASAGMTPSGPLTTRGGCVPGGLDLRPASAMQATLTPGRLWIQGAHAATQGGYAVAVDADELLTFSPGHATYGRIDAVVVKVHDPVYDGSTTPKGEVLVIEGAATATPVAPVSPANSEKLYEVTVPAGASAGSGGLDWAAAVAERRRYTAALGGIVPPGWAGGFDGGYPGQYRDLDGVLQRWSGTVWEPILRLGNNGVLQLGDARLYRDAVNTVGTDSILRFREAEPASDAISVRVRDDGASRLLIKASGALMWGAGGTAVVDTSLYRAAANTLKTDDDFIVRTHKAHYGESRTETLTFTNSTSHTRVVTFDTPFAAPPRVYCNINSGVGSTAQWHARAFGISATEFSLFVFGPAAASWSGVPVSWTALAS
ncbi:H-type lectin domain-containing protein [Streptomyces sp. SP18CS02]|uniref:H-type lectin domain-containing protein n=1 Tax=Streptomyces sp. SP18CS02 TaxID=3002531 RepID=UPI002E75E2C2|nr:H-type lectin domain-containing protein [Streptomyces sp. SP18CS02]MEE1751740.1 H-type lectin domain-containing protein [Streptomyces sp. SP18CS02]